MIEPQAPPVIESVVRRPASVSLAGWLSLVPGLGQLYNRQARKAAIFFAGVAALFVLSGVIPAVTDQMLRLWAPRGGFAVGLSLTLQMLSVLLFIGTFLGALAFWYAAFHDARISARLRNGAAARTGRWWLFWR